MASAPLLADAFGEGGEFGGGGGAEDFGFGGDALGDAEAQVRGNEADGRGAVEVVELGAGLAADGDGVFKAGGGDEGYACAFSFEHGVGADCGAVADDRDA